MFEEELVPLESLLPPELESKIKDYKIRVGLISFPDKDSAKHIMIVQRELDVGIIDPHTYEIEDERKEIITEVFVLTRAGKESKNGKMLSIVQSSLPQLLYWTISDALVYSNNRTLAEAALDFDFNSPGHMRSIWRNREETFLRFARLKLDEDMLEDVSDALEEVDADK